jgi:predicted nucleotidyltransferase
METLVKNIPLPQDKIADFCRRWKINEFALFGSVLRTDFGPDSDLDILVTFAPEADWSLFDHVRMQQQLNHLLQRQVDLLSRRAVEKSHNEPAAGKYWIRLRWSMSPDEVMALDIIRGARLAVEFKQGMDKDELLADI